MELEGAKQAFSFLQSAGVADKNRGIAKWIRECQAGCAHYFDIWHVARSISKAMIKLGKEKGCEKIADWVKGACNHTCDYENQHTLTDYLTKRPTILLHTKRLRYEP